MAYVPHLMRGIDGMIDSHYKVNFKSPEDILKEFEEVGFLYFVLCDGRMYCCDRMNDWAFADIEVADDTGNPNSAWKIVTPGFESLSEALDYPLFNGGSIRERFDDCTFYME